MPQTHALTAYGTINPLDALEDLVAARSWPFERLSDEEMSLTLTGPWGTYRLSFFWERDDSAVQVACRSPLLAPTEQCLPVDEILGRINPRLWLGHFEKDPESGEIIYRHTVLLADDSHAPGELLEHVVKIALTETERFYPAFDFVLQHNHSPEEALAAAMIDTCGEA